VGGPPGEGAEMEARIPKDATAAHGGSRGAVLHRVEAAWNDEGDVVPFLRARRRWRRIHDAAAKMLEKLEEEQ